MKKADFQGSPSGHLVSTIGNQWAFVPNPLPPKLDLGALALGLAEAAQCLGELNGIGRQIPDPYLVIRPLQAQEAVTSSSMEGTYTSVSDLLLLEAGASEADRPPDTREVLNYARALRQAIESLPKLPLCLRTLRDAHRTLLTGVRPHRGATVTPGEFKTDQNWIGSSKKISEARFIPPPPGETTQCLSQLERYIHREDREGAHALLDAALIHYQFETIHPFPDGNGRVGRILIPLFLIEREALAQPLLYVSPILDERKDEYVDLMYNVSRDGDWLSWISFFLDVMKAAAQRAISVAGKLLDLQTKYRSQLQTARRSALQLQILDMIFESPIVTIPQVQKRLKITYRAAKPHVDALVALKILEEVRGTQYPKFFQAKQLMKLISST